MRVSRFDFHHICTLYFLSSRKTMAKLLLLWWTSFLREELHLVTNQDHTGMRWDSAFRLHANLTLLRKAMLPQSFHGFNLMTVQTSCPNRIWRRLNLCLRRHSPETHWWILGQPPVTVTGLLKRCLWGSWFSWTYSKGFPLPVPAEEAH